MADAIKNAVSSASETVQQGISGVSKEGNKEVCVPCGWPGHTCNMECEFIVQWNAVGPVEFDVGTYRLRGDLRDVRTPFGSRCCMS